MLYYIFHSLKWYRVKWCNNKCISQYITIFVKIYEKNCTDQTVVACGIFVFASHKQAFII